MNQRAALRTVSYGYAIAVAHLGNQSGVSRSSLMREIPSRYRSGQALRSA